MPHIYTIFLPEHTQECTARAWFAECAQARVQPQPADRVGSVILVHSV
jgi:hypothetical protein